MKQIHIVGCGQVGSIVSKFLIKKGYSIKVYSPINNHDCQNPWGWVRRITLNQDERISKSIGKKLITMNKKYIKKGPMIISTSSGERKKHWDSWMKIRPQSDAKLLNRDVRSFFSQRQSSNLKLFLTKMKTCTENMMNFLYENKENMNNHVYLVFNQEIMNMNNTNLELEENVEYLLKEMEENRIQMIHKNRKIAMLEYMLEVAQKK